MRKSHQSTRGKRRNPCHVSPSSKHLKKRERALPRGKNATPVRFVQNSEKNKKKLTALAVSSNREHDEGYSPTLLELVL
jgi:hypothetical protein